MPALAIAGVSAFHRPIAPIDFGNCVWRGPFGRLLFVEARDRGSGSIA